MEGIHLSEHQIISRWQRLQNFSPGNDDTGSLDQDLSRQQLGLVGSFGRNAHRDRRDLSSSGLLVRYSVGWSWSKLKEKTDKKPSGCGVIIRSFTETSPTVAPPEVQRSDPTAMREGERGKGGSRAENVDASPGREYTPGYAVCR